jgi:hypothetical protein
MSIKKGQVVTLTYEDKKFNVIVIDPNGLGRGQPSVGFGYQMMENVSGLPQSTITDWATEIQGGSLIKPPSGNTFRATEIKSLDGNTLIVLEVSDWVALSADVIKRPGKVRKTTRDNLVDFLSWFAVKGFYASAYTILKQGYSPADDRAVSAWLHARLQGIVRRNKYTKFLQDCGCQEWFEYANWTNYIYRGLFGKDKKQMIEDWELIEGEKTIGRNYIPEVIGLEAVAYCENQVVELYVGDLHKAHDDAINYAKLKFFSGSLGRFE